MNRDGDERAATQRLPIVDAVWVIGTRASDVFLLAVSGVLVARALGPAGKGAVTLVAVVCQRALMLLALGVDIALVHYGGRRRWSPKELSRAALVLGSVLGCAAAAGAAGVLWTVFRSDVGAETLRWAVAVIAFLPATNVAQYLASLIVVQGRVVEVYLVFLAGGLLATAAAAVVLFTGWGAGPYLLLFAVAGLIEALGMAALSFRLGLLPPGRRVVGVSPALMRYGIRGHLGTVFQGINEGLDVFVLALFLPLGDVGLYSVAVATAGILSLVPEAISVVVLQRAATEEESRVGELTGSAARLTSALAVLGAAGLAVVGQPLIRLAFGGRFAGAGQALLFLLPGMWALGQWKILVQSLSGYGDAGARSISAGAGAVVTVVLNVILIPRFGIEGAAIASSIAYGVAFVVAAVIARRRFGPGLGNIVVPLKRDVRLLVSGLRSMATSARARLTSTTSLPRPDRKPPT